MKSDEKQLLQEVQKYKDSDPEVIDHMKKEVKVWPARLRIHFKIR